VEAGDDDSWQNQARTRNTNETTGTGKKTSKRVKEKD